jgi:hypothetical protein
MRCPFICPFMKHALSRGLLDQIGLIIQSVSKIFALYVTPVTLEGKQIRQCCYLQCNQLKHFNSYGARVTILVNGQQLLLRVLLDHFNGCHRTEGTDLVVSRI